MFGKNLTSKSSENKIFCGFRIFGYVLCQKEENLEMPEINRKLSKSKKHRVLTFTVTIKLLKAIPLLSKYNFGFNNKKATFKLQW